MWREVAIKILKVEADCNNVLEVEQVALIFWEEGQIVILFWECIGRLQYYFRRGGRLQ